MSEQDVKFCEKNRIKSSNNAALFKFDFVSFSIGSWGKGCKHYFKVLISTIKWSTVH